MANKGKGEEETTDEQRKVMRTQDIKYMEMKRVSEVNVSGSDSCHMRYLSLEWPLQCWPSTLSLINE